MRRISECNGERDCQIVDCVVNTGTEIDCVGLTGGELSPTETPFSPSE